MYYAIARWKPTEYVYPANIKKQFLSRLSSNPSPNLTNKHRKQQKNDNKNAKYY